MRLCLPTWDGELRCAASVPEPSAEAPKKHSKSINSSLPRSTRLGETSIGHVERTLRHNSCPACLGDSTELGRGECLGTVSAKDSAQTPNLQADAEGACRNSAIAACFMLTLGSFEGKRFKATASGIPWKVSLRTLRMRYVCVRRLSAWLLSSKFEDSGYSSASPLCKTGNGYRADTIPCWEKLHRFQASSLPPYV